jgi:hypothetical protein
MRANLDVQLQPFINSSVKVGQKRREERFITLCICVSIRAEDSVCHGYEYVDLHIGDPSFFFFLLKRKYILSWKKPKANDLWQQYRKAFYFKIMVANVFLTPLEDYRLIMRPQWPEELCWRECKLLVEPPMPDRSKDGTRRSVVPGPPSWGLGVGLTTPSRKIVLLRYPRSVWSRTMEEAKTHTGLWRH